MAWTQMPTSHVSFCCNMAICLQRFAASNGKARPDQKKLNAQRAKYLDPNFQRFFKPVAIPPSDTPTRTLW
jgi:hypothetical protein